MHIAISSKLWILTALESHKFLWLHSIELMFGDFTAMTVFDKDLSVVSSISLKDRQRSVIVTMTQPSQHHDTGWLNCLATKSKLYLHWCYINLSLVNHNLYLYKNYHYNSSLNFCTNLHTILRDFNLADLVHKWLSFEIKSVKLCIKVKATLKVDWI